MAINKKYFIGNWKMFGVPKSINILRKINSFVSGDKDNKKYRVIFTPPFTLLESFSKFFKNKKIHIGAQNSYHKDFFSSKGGKRRKKKRKTYKSKTKKRKKRHRKRKKTRKRRKKRKSRKKVFSPA